MRRPESPHNTTQFISESHEQTELELGREERATPPQSCCPVGIAGTMIGTILSA